MQFNSNLTDYKLWNGSVVLLQYTLHVTVCSFLVYSIFMEKENIVVKNITCKLFFLLVITLSLALKSVLK